MGQSVIADNWSLQTIVELFVDGIDPDNTSSIELAASGDHEFKSIPCSVISLEALFDFITDVILRDQILVDENFTNTWKLDNGPLQEICESSIVKPFNFLSTPEKLSEPREELVKRLLLTPSLKRDHQQSVEEWNSNKGVPHPFLSQVLWGGAGMLARAFVFETPYTPHPIRKRFFQQAGIAYVEDGSIARLCSTIREKRAAISRTQITQDPFITLQIQMDPLPVRVIRESNSLADIFRITLQLREEYQELRNWLGEYQQSITTGRFDDVKEQYNLLRSISTFVDSKIASGGNFEPSFTVGLDSLKLSFKGNPINALRNQFGVRSMINKLIFDASGQEELKRLLGFFGHRNTAVALRTSEHFAYRNRQK